jgi:inward rectifier potassium channel
MSTWQRPKQRKPQRERLTRMALGSYSVSKKGVPRYDWADPYRLAVSLSWPRFLGGLLGIYLTMNALFALAYLAVPGAIANARPWHFADAFFFSLETLATVGYGEMYPATLYGHVVSSVEITTGLAFTAILTGLVFVRFARPRAKFVFAAHPVITLHNNVPTLMLRVGNGRASTLASAAARISVLIAETSTEGAVFRRTYELKLVRASLPVFPLSWTLMHTIDETSPLYGMDEARMRQDTVRMFLAFEARDPDLATTVHDMHVYGPDEILFGMRYVDIISTDETGQPVADLTRINDVEPGPDVS